MPAFARAALPLALALLALLGLASAASAASFGSRPLKPGMKGKDVRVLQRSLSTLGFATTVNGVFRRPTFRSVKKLERKKTWKVDGKVSKKDSARIAALVAALKSTGYYLYGLRVPAVTLSSQKAGSARVDVVDANGSVVGAIPVSFAGAESQTASWNGLTPNGYAPDGIYLLRLGDSGNAQAVVTGGQTKAFALHARAFPVLGTHDFGGAGSRFGAPRGGHTHQGQDIAAACGTKLVLAEGGTIRVNSYQASGAGYYVVVRGAISGTDYVYMHMQGPAQAVVGQIVYTGQQIGTVGNTGSSTGCHLHFEHWTYPGWYLGGYPYDPLAELQSWDAYS